MKRTLTALLIVAAVSAVAVASGVTPQQAFRATTEVVVVDVLVTRGTKPVDRLVADDFEVRDSGVSQKVELVALETMPINLLIALDVSASVEGPRLDRLKDAVHAAVRALRPSDRAMVLNFSNDVRMSAHWDASPEELVHSIDGLTASGWTSLFDATFTAMTLPATAGHRRLLLVFTDGRDTSSWLRATEVLKVAEQAQLTVYGVGVDGLWMGRVNLQSGSNGTNWQGFYEQVRGIAPSLLRQRLLSDPVGYRALFLPVLVNDTGGELLGTTDADLSRTFLDVLDRFSRRYLLTYTPAGVPQAGWHPIEVRVKDPSVTVTARRGYSR